ncbi:hypothetical protein OPV22_010679 [Ensete ventricosum]|uniref:Secreted protein n=1 Tax=Ensete ventricosum TaxID=4639 RepID=A0AAV8RHB8_ENSVE|nr:hypothetical protein OPV22_010679 [Ensete ventricosum]
MLWLLNGETMHLTGSTLVFLVANFASPQATGCHLEFPVLRAAVYWCLTPLTATFRILRCASPTTVIWVASIDLVISTDMLCTIHSRNDACADPRFSRKREMLKPTTDTANRHGESRETKKYPSVYQVCHDGDRDRNNGGIIRSLQAVHSPVLLFNSSSSSSLRFSLFPFHVLLT